MAPGREVRGACSTWDSVLLSASEGSGTLPCQGCQVNNFSVFQFIV